MSELPQASCPPPFPVRGAECSGTKPAGAERRMRRRPDRQEVEALRDRLAALQAAKGYSFNPDTALVVELLEELMMTKERHGRMTCPCRLSSGNYENDRDIICPCAYREADVREFGACYCRLYTSKEWNAGELPHVLVPERRPPEKIIW